ncbi:MAG TPA: transcriptional regulator [Candidatus Binatia bacterium]|nr:transcriptional regulator [Candidatus Binatia bacterium]
MPERPAPAEMLDRLAALAEPVRRRLYEVVARAGEPVDRDTAAERAGVGRPLAAFHLDRLVLAGLLGVEYRRRTGRTGPGAGRPAKFYLRPRDEQVSVDLPPRSYDVAAEILATGVERLSRARETVLEVARERGRELAEQAATTDAYGGPRLIPLLESQGYEPFEDADGVVRLRNCPFHVLVGEHRELTCAMNHALLDGAATALADTGYRAVAQPAEGRCCVAFVPAAEVPGA